MQISHTCFMVYTLFHPVTWYESRVQNLELYLNEKHADLVEDLWSLTAFLYKG